MRADDNEETFWRRMKVHQETELPVISSYMKTKLIANLNSENSEEEIVNEFLNKIDFLF